MPLAAKAIEKKVNPKTKWLCLSLEADPEIAESVADVFSRYASGSVVIASTNIDDEIDGAGKMSGPLRISAYLEHNSELENKRLKIEQALSSLRLIQHIPALIAEEVGDENWMESWKQHFKPLSIGRKFLIQPAWLAAEQSGRNIIRIDPGMAFGTGVHPTTQLALTMIEESIRPRMSLLDIGSGSGILAIGAAMLGADPVFGVDTDAQAVDNASMHAELNKSSASFSQGSVENILSGKSGVKKADLVVANILATVLLRLIDEGLTDLVAKEGYLILSGILEEQQANMRVALREKKFQIVEIKTSGDWIGIKAARQ